MIILATQIALDIGLSQAVQKQDSETEKMVESFVEEINSLTSLAVALMKGKSLDDNVDVTKPHPSDFDQPSISHDPDTTTVIITGEGPTITTPIHEGQRSSHARLVSKIQKMENIIMVLSSYRYKAVEITSVLSEIRNVSNSFRWQSLLHYEWSTQDSQASLATMGASLRYGCHYTGSAGRLVLTPAMEKAVCYLLRAVKQGDSSLVMGKEVSTLYVCSSKPYSGKILRDPIFSFFVEEN